MAGDTCRKREKKRESEHIKFFGWWIGLVHCLKIFGEEKIRIGFVGWVANKKT